MPPKKAKKEKMKKATSSLDDVDTTVLTRDKLEEFCVNVYEAIVKEQQHSEFLRLDRDKLTNMVAISREQLIDSKNAILTKQNEIQAAEDEHRLAMWTNRQKLIYLASERNIDYLNSKLESIRKVNSEQLDHEGRMNQLLSDINELKNETTNLEEAFCKGKLNQEIAHAENKSNVREADKEAHMLNENRREKIYQIKLKELGTKFGREYAILEKRENKEIALHLKTNTKFITDLKHYYNQIVYHNLSVINVMRAEFQQEKTKSAVTEKQYLQLKSENTYLVSTLNQSTTEESRLRGKLMNSQKDKNQLKCIKAELNEHKLNLEHKKIELDVMCMRVGKKDKVMNNKIAENNKLMIIMRSAAEEVILMLEFIVIHLYHKNKEADSTLDNIRSICLEKYKQYESSATLKQIPIYQNTFLDEMNYQIATVAAQREQILKTYKAILKKYHIHVDNTGFVPLELENILKNTSCLRVLVNEN